MGGGANKPLINSLNTLNTLKNSNSKELAKNLNKIQESKIKESNLDFNLQKDSSLSKDSKITKKSKLQSLQKDSKIQPKTISKISISIIASILLSQSLVALPSGGKFVGGSSGSIKVNGKEMNITGNNTNHIIAWGGGFNINKGESVNFLGNNKSYLNLDYTNKASQILGNLNGNGNNIYLVNPSGVLIGQNASINANKFVASNTIDDTTLNSFKTQTKLVESFSPVFQPNKGNIVNLGTIKANNGITLIGDTIDIRGGKLENKGGGNNKNDSIYFVGENIYIDADAANLSSNNNVYATAFSEGYIQRQMNKFQKDNFQFGDFKNLITNEKYDYESKGEIEGKSFKKAITLGNGNADEALSEWYWFANGWNNNNGDTRSVDEFRLVGDIDFSKQLNGKDRTIIDFSNNGNNKTYTGNYAAPTNNGNGNLVNADYSDAMMVGEYNKGFSVVFDGSGYTLGNVDIDTQIGSVAAIFGNTNTAEIKNLAIDTIDIDSLNSAGALVGRASDSYISNINVKNVNINGGYGVGGLIGSVHESQISNIAMSNIKVEGLEAAGGLTGFAYGKLTISDITLSDLWVYQKPEGSNGNDGGAGGLIGWSANDGITIENVVLNQIHEVVATFDDTMSQQEWASAGGLVGRLVNTGTSYFKNIILNGIGKIEAKEINNLVSGTTYSQTQAGGFIGSLNGNSNTQNVYLYFNDDSTIKASGGYNHQDYVGKFYGYVETYNNPNVSLNNVNLYYNDNPSPSLANPIKDADSSNSTYYNQTINPTDKDIASNKINLYTYSDSAQGIKDFQTALEQQNNSGGAFETNKIVNIGDDSNPIYSFEQTTGSNITPPTDPSLPNIDLGNVVLEKDDFISLDSTIKEIIHEILNENYGINIALDKNGYISQETLDKLINISNTIDEILKGIESKESEATLDTKIHKLFELILVDSNPNTAELESLKQSLNFLRAFYDGDNGLKDDFAKWYSKDNSIDKYSYVKDSILKLKSFINGEGNYNGNGLINQISSINNNLKALESLKQRIKAAQKYYQEALKAKLPYETLEGIYNGMVKTINESYIQALGVLETLKGEDRDYLTHLYKEYSIKEDSGFDDIRGTFSFSGNDILSKIDSIILEDKPALTPPTKEEVGDDPTKENNPDVPNNLQKIADLASKEAILILPAQEKQEAIVEDGKERGRLCIVSDNAKTNNPCMAITY
ncbi:filamentous hemagglutinin N-terminal domain-containing protein [Helicobacter pullorum]|uniref:filamentous hemagglutinin N-terminal domain-containing protein n=1 Tax=Helicobacter pullorum TaxID=35818 RepID=UPI0008169F00|nr:filamentous hemagglutinin N-terminal domain-containing protein [Helicobacter pullorum]OCR08748.1 hypothetical protein A7X13_06935 [Helicobacter pullorum]